VEYGPSVIAPRTEHDRLASRCGLSSAATPVEAARLAEEQNHRIDEWRAGREKAGIRTSGGNCRLADREIRDQSSFTQKKPATRAFYSGALRALGQFQLETITLGNVQAKALQPKHVDQVYLALQKIDPVTDQPTQLPWANAIMRSARRHWRGAFIVSVSAGVSLPQTLSRRWN
jgi:hypothetical protein